MLRHCKRGHDSESHQIRPAAEQQCHVIDSAAAECDYASPLHGHRPGQPSIWMHSFTMVFAHISMGESRQQLTSKQLASCHTLSWSGHLTQRVKCKSSERGENHITRQK
jgi:hypothetical protein